ncbi:MAG TPA: amidase [Candidatus Sulfotelmatobacter sp.]|nr:amidase [Candidatus Sulfotelmatobacter sp.]
MTELAFRSATELAAEIAQRRLGSLELLDYFLARVDRFNPKLNILIAQDRDGARARAKAADAALARGERWGPLHGLPMTVKESYDVKGLPTTWGVPALKGSIAATNSVVVDRLQAAGAVVFGKTNVPLLLGDLQSYNEVYGQTGNPWDPGRTPGGSSGGSAAALAAGLTGLEAGSDIGGSIRNPAHFCGVFGHKPTWGIVPPRGHAINGVLTPGDISVVGPLARSAEDLALALDCIAGPDVMQAPGWQLALPAPRQKSLKDFRVALWFQDPVCAVDRAITDRLQAIAERLGKLGARIDDKARPKFDSRRSHEIFLKLMLAVVTARSPQENFDKARAEVGGLKPEDLSFGAMATRAAALHHREWIAANEERTRLRWAWHAFFGDYDVVLAPMAAVPAFKHDHSEPQTRRTLQVNGRSEAYLDQIFWAGLAGVVYLPATVAPAGLSPDGLPVGVQIIGPELGDRTTIEFARLLAAEIGGFQPPPGYA